MPSFTNSIIIFHTPAEENYQRGEEFFFSDSIFLVLLIFLFLHRYIFFFFFTDVDQGGSWERNKCGWWFDLPFSHPHPLTCRFLRLPSYTCLLLFLPCVCFASLDSYISSGTLILAALQALQKYYYYYYCKQQLDMQQEVISFSLLI